MGIIILILVLSCLVTISITIYGNRKEQHRRMEEWIRQVKKSRGE